jgi:hypothetical protein
MDIPGHRNHIPVEHRRVVRANAKPTAAPKRQSGPVQGGGRRRPGGAIIGIGRQWHRGRQGGALIGRGHLFQGAPALGDILANGHAQPHQPVGAPPQGDVVANGHAHEPRGPQQPRGPVPQGDVIADGHIAVPRVYDRTRYANGGRQAYIEESFWTRQKRLY